LAAPANDLNSLLDTSRLHTLLGGPPPPKKALLIISGIRSFCDRQQAADWFKEHASRISFLQIRRCLFVDSRIMVAQKLLQNVLSQGVPPFRSLEYAVHRDAIATCFNAVGVYSIDEHGLYEETRRNLPLLVKHAYESSWADNSMVSIILDNVVNSEFPDVFLEPFRERCLKKYQSLKQQNQQRVKSVSATIEELALRQAKLEAVLRRINVLRQVAHQSFCDGQDVANARIRAAAETLGMEGVCLDTVEKQSSFERRLVGVTDLTVANACMDAVSLFWSGRSLTRHTTEGLVFASRAAAGPLVHAFVAWASRVARMECCSKIAMKSILTWLETALGERFDLHGFSISSGHWDSSALEQADVTANDTGSCAMDAFHSYQFAALPVHNVGGSMNMLFWPFASASSLNELDDGDMRNVSGALVQDFDDIWSKADGRIVVFQKVHWSRLGLDTVQTVVDVMVHELITHVEAQLSEALDAVRDCFQSPTAIAANADKFLDVLETLLDPCGV